jgi:hypothetical protein
MDHDHRDLVLRFFVDGAFTFYLFHLSGIYVAANLSGRVLAMMCWRPLQSVSSSCRRWCRPLHRWVIAPSRALRLL